MPQLVPFHFVNQASFTLIVLGLLIYVFSKYLLPLVLRLFIARVIMSSTKK